MTATHNQDVFVARAIAAVAALAPIALILLAGTLPRVSPKASLWCMDA